MLADRALSGDHVEDGGAEGGQTGDDIGEKDHGDTVSDTALIDLLGQPHDERGARAVAGDDDDCGEDAGVQNDVVGLQELIVTDGGDQAQSDRDVSGILVDLLLPLFAFLREVLEIRDGDGEELHDDGRGDIGVDTQREQRPLGDGGTGDDVQILEDTGAEHACAFKGRRVHIGDRDRAAEPVEHNDEQGEEKLFLQIRNFPGVFQRCEHFISPRSFHLPLRSSLSRKPRRLWLQR